MLVWEVAAPGNESSTANLAGGLFFHQRAISPMVMILQNESGFR